MKKQLEIDIIDKNRFNELIRYEHYLHRVNSTKPAIQYQITYDRQIVAIMEWSAIFKPVLLRFPFLQHYEIIDNSRFLIRKEWELFERPIEIYNLGSRSMSMGIKQVRLDWQNISGYLPKLLISYVDCSKGYTGTVYRASNWREIEESAGKNYNQRAKKDYKPTPKKTFIYPLIKTFHIQPVTFFDKQFLRDHWDIMNPVAQYNYRPHEQKTS